MAIAVGSVSNTPTSGSRTNTTITAPTGITNGDLLVAVIAVGDGTGLPALTVSPPSGFTEVTNSPSAAAKADPYTISIHVFYKVASSEAGNYTFSHTSADTEGYMYRLTGVDTSTPIDVTPSATQFVSAPNGGVTQYGAVTTTTNGAFIIYAESIWDAVGSGTISGTNPTVSVRRSGSGTWLGDGLQTTAGTTTARSRTNGNTSANPWVSLVVAIRPATGGSSSVGASSGVGAAAAVGQSTKAATATQTGVGAAAGTGRATAAASGSLSGVGAQSGSGVALSSIVGSAAGTGSASGVGSSTAVAVGSEAGSCLASGVGASSATGVGAQAGAGVQAGVGSSTAVSLGSASGVGAAAGSSSQSSVGLSSGAGTASGVGASLATSAGSAVGTGSAASVGAATTEGVGSTAGVGSVAGAGLATFEGVGSAAGAGSAAAVSFIGSVANASGTSSVAGVGAALAVSVGSLSGVGSVVGRSLVEDSTPPVGGGGGTPLYHGKGGRRRDKDKHPDQAIIDALDRAIDKLEGRATPVSMAALGELKAVERQVDGLEDATPRISSGIVNAIAGIASSKNVPELNKKIDRIETLLGQWEKLERDRQDDEDAVSILL